ncbi:hypothetical protein CCHR01_14571 [Colletotrichum chrysophilum]|uniref:Uncharacterized protein n=1 Tax=Colletotrichum chrysophilum TaxID=1836956 RepID=A0AAD9A7S1_9PEZI|nr:hypothetical protein CCHR01_14571 [Colletotrichum chrysophilum]
MPTRPPTYNDGERGAVSSRHNEYNQPQATSSATNNTCTLPLPDLGLSSGLKSGLQVSSQVRRKWGESTPRAARQSKKDQVRAPGFEGGTLGT